MAIVGYILSVFVGITLGLIGGGGSILSVPILKYAFGIADSALVTSYSLFIVGITSLIGVFRHYKMGNIHLKTAFTFAVPSIFSLLFIRKIIVPQIPAVLFNIGDFSLSKNVFLMLVFAVLMILAAYNMIKKSSPKAQPAPNPFRLILIGVMVGVVTGFLGAGGGFLIIPALILFAGLQMKEAIGTSLLIIAINTLIGFAGDVANGVQIDYPFLLTVSAMAVVGIFIGTFLSKKIDGNQLKPAFGWFVLIMGIYIILKEIVFH